jgi:hypothetical protein
LTEEHRLRALRRTFGLKSEEVTGEWRRLHNEEVTGEWRRLHNEEVTGEWRRLHNEELNPLNAELNPICHLLALLGAHHILHVTRIRVKDLYSLPNIIRVIKSRK